MEETMNNEVEVTTEEQRLPEMESSPEYSEELPSGPSKGFVTLVVGAIAATAVGTAVLIGRHKKKKAEKEKEKSEKILEESGVETVEVETVEVEGVPKK